VAKNLCILSNLLKFKIILLLQANIADLKDEFLANSLALCQFIVI